MSTENSIGARDFGRITLGDVRQLRPNIGNHRDGDHMVSEAGTKEFTTDGKDGFFDRADQALQFVKRGALTDIVYLAESGQQFVLFNKGGNDFDELTADQYVQRVSEDKVEPEAEVDIPTSAPPQLVPKSRPELGSAALARTYAWASKLTD